MIGLEPLERTSFFSGRLLSADDLRREQEFFLARLRRQNRFLHGWGIVSGLGVSLNGKDTVIIEPGLAIDCAGNELVLPAEARISVKAVGSTQYLVLRYAEVEVAETPSGSGASHFLRVRESALVELVAANPTANHRGLGRGTPGCGELHPLCLAIITKQGSRRRVVVPRL
jgi:hypothetical protein